MVFNCRPFSQNVLGLYESIKRMNRLYLQTRSLEELSDSINGLKIDDMLAGTKANPAFRCGLIVISQEEVANLDAMIEEISKYTERYVHWNTDRMLKQNFLQQFKHLSNECKMLILSYLESEDFRSNVRSNLINSGTFLIQAMWINEDMNLEHTAPIIIEGKPPEIISKFHKKMIKSDEPGIQNKPSHKSFLFTNLNGIQELFKIGFGNLFEYCNNMKNELRALTEKVEAGTADGIRSFLENGKIDGTEIIETDSCISEVWRLSLNQETDHKMLWIVGLWGNREEMFWCERCIKDGLDEMKDSWDFIFPGPVSNINDSVCLFHPNSNSLKATEVLAEVNKAIMETGSDCPEIESVSISKALLTSEIQRFNENAELLISVL